MTHDNDDRKDDKDAPTTIFCRTSTREQARDLQAHLRFKNFDQLWDFLILNQKRNDRRIVEWQKSNGKK